MFFISQSTDISEDASNRQMQLREAVMKHEGVKGCHGIYINDDQKFVSFDILRDFKVRDTESFGNELKKEVQEIFPEYLINVNFDIDYTD